MIFNKIKKKMDLEISISTLNLNDNSNTEPNNGSSTGPNTETSLKFCYQFNNNNLNNADNTNNSNDETSQLLNNNETNQSSNNNETNQSSDNNNLKIEITKGDGLQYLDSLENNSVDLILTDPPYIISKESGMNTHYQTVKENEKKGIKFVKTEADWVKYKKKLKKPQEELDNDQGPGWSKENYLKYGTILGKKYCNQTDYGKWDNNFTEEQLEKFIKKYYNKLRKGGTLIIWFDLWKISNLKEMMEKAKFKQIRFIEWIKTNPQPINSKINYLTNCREIALIGVKGGKPTFNSKYDKGIYEYPMASGKNRFHPTQKNLSLFEELIKKHSNENDLIVDTFWVVAQQLWRAETALEILKAVK